MFRSYRDHLQVDICNILGSAQIVCRREISLIAGIKLKITIKIADNSYGNLQILKSSVVGSGILLVAVTWFDTGCIGLKV